MTKEEKIQDVYEKLGFEWNKCSKYITENGVLILQTPDLKCTLRGYENLVKDENKFSAFGKEGLKLQPTDLAGIYNNNGWIKIESEDDLPKDEYELYFVTGSNTNVHQCIYHIGIKEYWLKTFTHYQPIQKPQPPIY